MAEVRVAQPAQQINLEERAAHLNELIADADREVVRDYHERLAMSWIYHDSALEGVVYTFHELKAAIDNQVVSDSSLIPVYDEIRQHKSAIELIHELAEKKRGAITLDVLKKIYSKLAPEECEGKGPPKYRKDMPLHRLYFHEISQPDKISAKMRQLVDWMVSPETKRSMHPVRLAAKAHHMMMQVYPFPKHSGKVGRLLLNLILLRHGYPPAIIHSTERQRYYDALKQGPNAVAIIVNEALISSVESAIKFFEDGGVPEEMRGRISRIA
jgi:Fic family protein